MTAIDRLVENLKPTAKPPRGFGFWSRKLIVAWLKQNQKKEAK
jgi:hypothetical protein